MSESQRRKETPMFRGVKGYFPDALAAVARLAFKAGQKHTPGQPIHWCRSKSGDHLDCIERHMATYDETDPEFGELHMVAVTMRALMQLQLMEERRLGKPKAPHSFDPACPACAAEGTDK